MTSKLVEGDNPLDFLDSSMIPKIYKGTKKEPCTLPEKDGKFVIEDLAKVAIFLCKYHTLIVYEIISAKKISYSIKTFSVIVVEIRKC